MCLFLILPTSLFTFYLGVQEIAPLNTSFIGERSRDLIMVRISVFGGHFICVIRLSK